MGYLAAIGSVFQAGQQQQVADNNKYALEKEGMQAKSLSDQSYANQIRRNVMTNGANVATAVQSGGGVGGSTKGVLDQNALNSALDALNIKYQGIIKKDTYNQQAEFDQAAATQEETGTALRGAASLLKVYQPNMGYPGVS